MVVLCGLILVFDCSGVTLAVGRPHKVFIKVGIVIVAVLADAIEVLRIAHHRQHRRIVVQRVPTNWVRAERSLHVDVVMVLATAHPKLDCLTHLAGLGLAVRADVVAGDVGHLDAHRLQRRPLVWRHRHIDADHRDVLVALASQLERRVEARLSAAAVAGETDELILVRRIEPLLLHVLKDRCAAVVCDLLGVVVVDLAAQHPQVRRDLRLSERRPVDVDLRLTVRPILDLDRLGPQRLRTV